ncbi:thiamine pyrophosphate-dependent enzyme [Neobacillus mesonae]|uniref:thiamine pyrophosphate-dependent enzyme n=1 Tax=Neobacillus mesonae TaxID=1193713 RepID=UPI00203F1EAD|nr:thiamine pyrophosphate-dependent enzyme [Neobacillus mesonae]MCM3568455.1 thiamine pyrophosphate-binding protein [Neobacillus mesonae]
MENSLTGGQAIVEILKKEEIKHVFTVPGESFIPILDGLYDEKDITLISNRHEGGASFMAEAYAKASGQVAVVMATRGVGAANLSIGIHTAKENSTPMVVLLGQVKSSFRGREGFQEVDLDLFLKDLCKWTVEINEVNRIPELVQRAFRVAKCGRPGPVAVSLPEDILKQSAKLKIKNKSICPKPRPSKNEVKEFFGLLRKAERPVIIAGAGINLSSAEKNLLLFAEKYQIPVMAAFRRHDVFPNNHVLYAGHLGMGTFDGIKETVKKADTIIAIGTRFSETTTQGYSIISDDQTMIHIDIEYSMLGKVYEPSLGIVADADEALLALINEENTNILQNKWESWAIERRKIFEDVTYVENHKHEQSVDNKQIISILQQYLPANAILVNDAGNFAGWVQTFFKFNSPKSYIGAASGAMGYAMPAAVGAKLAQPERTVVSLSGDGGIMMTIQELETAVRYKVPIISLIFNNNMHGSIRMFQEIAYPYREIGTSLGNPDFVELGSSFGVYSQRVSSDTEFEQAFINALESNKTSLIEITCNPDQISIHSTITGIRKKAVNKEKVELS